MGDRTISEICDEALMFLNGCDPYEAVRPIDIIGYFHEILAIEAEKDDDLR